MIATSTCDAARRAKYATDKVPLVRRTTQEYSGFSRAVPDFHSSDLFVEELLKRQSSSTSEQDVIENLRRQVSDYRGRMEIMQKQNLIILRNSNQVEEVNKQLNRKNLELSDKLKLQAEKLQQMESQLSTFLASANSRNSSENQGELIRKADDLAHKNAQLERTLAERERQIEMLSMDLSTINQRMQSEAQKNADRTAEVETLKQKLEDADLENFDLQGRVRDLSTKLDHALVLHEEAQQRLEQVGETHIARQHEAELQVLLDKTEEEKRTLATQMQSEIDLATQLSRNLKEKEDMNAQLLAENRAILSQLNELRDRFVTVMNENAALTETSQRQASKIRGLKSEVEAVVVFKEELERLKGMIREQNETDLNTKASTMEVMDALHAKNAQLEQQIRTLLAQQQAAQVPLPPSPVKRSGVAPPAEVMLEEAEGDRSVLDEADIEQLEDAEIPSEESLPSVVSNEAVATILKKYDDVLNKIAELEEELSQTYVRLSEMKTANERLLDENATLTDIRGDLQNKYESVMHVNEQLQMEAETVPL